MQTENLEDRVAVLEQQMQELRQLVKPSGAEQDWQSTVGMLADDPEFDEILRLGREYRQSQQGTAE